MEKKSALIIVIGLLVISLFLPSVSSLPPPVGIAGYITDSNGTFLSGATITVQNVDTNDTDTATSNVDGLYVCSLSASDSDLLTASVVYNNLTGSNSTYVNTDILTQWLNVTALPSGSLVADFVFSPFRPKPNENVVFRDLSHGQPESWYWNFGDGTTSVGKHQNHVYESSGTYIVSLEVRKGSDSDRAQKTVTVSPAGVPFIPKPQPPVYPSGYTIEECYRMLNGDKLKKSDSHITVVVMDSGLQPQVYDNTDLNKIIIKYHSFYENGYDFNGHGTFTNCQIAYLLQLKAPNAKQISYRAFNAGGTSEEYIFLESLETIKQLKPDVVSISSGAFGSPNDVYSKKVKELHDMGIIVVCAAGNFGPASSTILSPACSPYVICLGASNPEQTVDYLGDDTICTWSSRGPVLDISEYKPDVVAPGESIIGPWMNVERVRSGTSFSTPLISGGAAVIVAENKGLVDIVKLLWFWNKGVVPDAFEGAIESTCLEKGDENAWGNGMVQLDAASHSFHGKLVILIIIPILVIAFIISLIVVVYWKREKIFGLQST